ncbi:uncharacterized protein LOC119712260 [Motacilla alba alba]|uniref:uncharacterized protein LOC119712260 n=1 Tax=Motacilla alba alba TaxID=1094192 RepID=UPI0018D51829|nr:uncharacterized protein LOC119712260 [Motacilla alba alba]
MAGIAHTQTDIRIHRRTNGNRDADRSLQANAQLLCPELHPIGFMDTQEAWGFVPRSWIRVSAFLSRALKDNSGVPTGQQREDVRELTMGAKERQGLSMLSCTMPARCPGPQPGAAACDVQRAERRPAAPALASAPFPGGTGREPERQRRRAEPRGGAGGGPEEAARPQQSRGSGAQRGSAGGAAPCGGLGPRGCRRWPRCCSWLRPELKCSSSRSWRPPRAPASASSAHTPISGWAISSTSTVSCRAKAPNSWRSLLKRPRRCEPLKGV